MTLPALIDEEEAIAATIILIECEVFRTRTTPQASRAWLESTARDFLLNDLMDRMKVIAAADAGDELADAILAYVFHSMLDRGETPPASMVAYEARARARGPLKRKRGQHAWWENWRRDIGIACVVYLAHIQLGLNPTRNRESRRARRPSACSIVAEALRRTGTDISESRVQNISAGLSGEIIAFAAARGTFPSIRRN